MRRAGLIFGFLLATSVAVRAQVPDTLAVPADTLVAPPDTSVVAAAPPETPRPPFPVDDVIAFWRDLRGEPIDTMPPERRLAVHPTELLEALPGSFVYSFRTGGWPEAWSMGGRDPAAAGLLRDGRPFHSLTTGRALFEMLPLGLVDPVRLASAHEGRPTALVTNMQTFDAPRPITGLRYQSDDNGLQQAELYHAQRRLVSIFGSEGLLNLSAAYLGRASRGEYPGSVLRRERGVFARARFARQNWSLTVSNLHSRHRVGAHHGVIPQPPTVYETIFVRPGAVVRRPEARRQTIRNELDVTWRAAVLPEAFTVTAYWTAESYRYYDSRIELPARVHRYGARAEQPLVGPRLPLRVHGWLERVENDSAFVRETRRHALEASLSDSLSAGLFGVMGRAAVLSTHRETSPAGEVRLAFGSPRTHLFAGASTTPVDLPRMFEDGFGAFIAPLDADGGRAWDARIGGRAEIGPFALRLDAVGQRDAGLVIASTDAERDVLMLHAGHTAERAGVTGHLGWRENRARGVYAGASSTLIHWLTVPDIPGVAPLDETLPTLHATGRVGARMLLFQGDLDADFSVRGRYWSAMQGRVLHPSTGLLVVPAADARRHDASGLLDVVFEGGVRTATIIVALENVLSGTDVTRGNLIVPDYPLPERRLRFAVFWPIMD